MSKGTLTGAVWHIVAIVGALAGLIVYIVTSTTGYLAGGGISALLIAMTVVALLVLAADIFLKDRLGAVARDLALLGSLALIAASFALFILARVPLAADVYFIPVNYPQAEETALNISLVGLALYLIAVLALLIESFSARRAATAHGHVALAHS